eukprot:GHVU01126914.1.p1 GENE.GHVU01126914.1~~GHVU01126914.1.p1  ORF type:complete len:382 (-),score=67.39 GHVU01126914.1:5299-6444(-)
MDVHTDVYVHVSLRGRAGGGVPTGSSDRSPSPSSTRSSGSSSRGTGTDLTGAGCMLEKAVVCVIPPAQTLVADDGETAMTSSGFIGNGMPSSLAAAASTVEPSIISSTAAASVSSASVATAPAAAALKPAARVDNHVGDRPPCEANRHEDRLREQEMCPRVEDDHQQFSSSSRTANEFDGSKMEDQDGPRRAGAEAERERVIAHHIHEILKVIEDPSRPGLRATPRRFARAMLDLTSGYTRTVQDVVGNGIFEEAHDDRVLVRDIPISSLCEHHMLPFYGKCHIGYIPNGRILGLSKLARIADLFSRRLQVQERLGQQIAAAVSAAVDAKGVGVVIDATHTCMSMRGIMKEGAVTSTSHLLGVMRDDPVHRREFLEAAGRR